MWASGSGFPPLTVKLVKNGAPRVSVFSGERESSYPTSERKSALRYGAGLGGMDGDLEAGGEFV